MSTTDTTLATLSTRQLADGLLANPNPKVDDFLTLFQAIHVQGGRVETSSYGVLTSLTSPSQAPKPWTDNRSKITKRLAKALVQFDDWLTARDEEREAERRKQQDKADKRRKAADNRRKLAISALERVAKSGEGTDAVEAARSLINEAY